jgi:hypothetical protein
VQCYRRRFLAIVHALKNSNKQLLQALGNGHCISKRKFRKVLLDLLALAHRTSPIIMDADESESESDEENVPKGHKRKLNKLSTTPSGPSPTPVRLREAEAVLTSNTVSCNARGAQ